MNRALPADTQVPCPLLHLKVKTLFLLTKGNDASSLKSAEANAGVTAWKPRLWEVPTPRAAMLRGGINAGRLSSKDVRM